MSEQKSFFKSSFFQVAVGLSVGAFGCGVVLWLCFIGFAALNSNDALRWYSLHPELKVMKKLPSPDEMHLAMVAKDRERVYVSMCRNDKPENYGLGNVLTQKSDFVDAQWLTAKCLRVYCKKTPKPSFSVKSFGGYHHDVQIELVPVD